MGGAPDSFRTLWDWPAFKLETMFGRSIPETWDAHFTEFTEKMWLRMRLAGSLGTA